jgi:hypothetical protein
MPSALSTVPDKAPSEITEIVPPEILAPPMRHERRGLLRDECALVLDGFLRRLARQEALCRRVLGQVAAAFLERRAHHRLGFARVGDYARERLGISAREVQSLAQVVVAMEGLPKISAAFEHGEISWAQVRLLVTMATRETEDQWLSLARGRTVRALESSCKQAGEPPARRAEAETDEGEDDSVEGEPRVPFRVSCPRRVSTSWRRALELARRMTGEELPIWQAAEAIAAEALSAVESGSLGELTDRDLADPRQEGGGSARRPETHCASDTGETYDPFPDIDWSVVEESIPEPVESLGRELHGADAFALDERMRRVVPSMQRIDWQIGRLLRLFLDMRLHKMMGFASASRYVRERLGMSTRKGRALVHLERHGAKFPQLASAYRSGEISWVRALAVLPVIGEQRASDWIERAKSVTVRRLIDEVDWAIETRDAVVPFQSIAPPPPRANLVRPERQMCAREERPVLDSEIAFFGPASVVALFRTAVSAFARPSESPWRGLERLLDHVNGEWANQPRHRDPVFAREGWRCAVPACSSRRNLHDHHVLFRSRGGDNGRDNRVAVCAWHHLRGLHAGTVRAHGRAPAEITWEIGSTPSRSPLLRLHGERYASA